MTDKQLKFVWETIFELTHYLSSQLEACSGTKKQLAPALKDHSNGHKAMKLIHKERVRIDKSKNKNQGGKKP